ncbi:MAG TPA: hypothetical protein VJV78_08180 [Polyangiales bacterium]|nr:hypothetical protein [Polyangiales bacterium]
MQPTVFVSTDFYALFSDEAHAWEVRVLLFLCALSVGLLVQAARASHERRRRGLAIVVASSGVGVITASLLMRLAQSAPAAPPVYRYDLGGPWLILWVTFCAIEWLFVITQVQGRLFRAAFNSLGLLGICAVGVGLQESSFADPNTHSLWWGQFCWAELILVCILPFLAARRLSNRSTRILAWLGTVLMGLLIVGFSYSALLLDKQWTIVVFLGVAGTLSFMTRHLLIAMPRAVGTNSDRPAISRRQLGWVLGSFCVLAFSAISFCFHLLPSALNILAAALACAALVELTAGGPLLAMGPSVKEKLFGRGSTVRAGASKLLRFLVRAARAALAPARAIALPARLKFFARLMTAFVVLVVLQQWPNRNKIVIRSFPMFSSGVKAVDENPDDLGEAIAARAVAQIAMLASELKAGSLSSGRSAGFDTADTAPGSDLSPNAQSSDPILATLDSQDDIKAVTQNDTLKIFGLEVRIGTVIAPIQRALEPLFNMRVVTGRLQLKSGRLVLFATSSTGEPWQFAGSDEKIADGLAFAIISSDPRWRSAGMTTVLDAYRVYTLGLSEYRHYQRLTAPGSDGGEAHQPLMRAIAAFREATRWDPGFAFAHYYLGLALAPAGEPAAAVEELRIATNVNSDFGPAYAALGNVLLHYSDFVPRYLAARAEFSRVEAPQAWEKRNADAVDAFKQVLSLDKVVSTSDRATAYLGLCATGLPRRTELEQPDVHERFQHAFYSCAMSTRTYEASLEGTRLSPSQVSARAGALFWLGTILERDGRYASQTKQPVAVPGRTKQVPLPSTTVDWSCDASDAKPVCPKEGECKLQWTIPASARATQALEKYSLAANLISKPPSAVCPIARILAALGSRDTLEQSRKDFEVQLSLGRALLSRARKELPNKSSTPLFEAAFTALGAAVEMAPTSTDALNQYAYAYRVWHAHVRQHTATSTVSTYLAQSADNAETCAREAVKLAAQRKSAPYYAMVLSTLAEVLIERDRPDEAFPLLELALGKVDVGQLDEIRWDAVEAHKALQRAAAKSDENTFTISRTGVDGKACSVAMWRRQLHQSQQHREVRYFISERVCSARAKSDTADVDFELKFYRYETGCGINTLRMAPINVPSGGQLFLHVRDGEIDTYIDDTDTFPLSDDGQDTIVEVWYKPPGGSSDCIRVSNREALPKQPIGNLVLVSVAQKAIQGAAPSAERE